MTAHAASSPVELPEATVVSPAALKRLAATMRALANPVRLEILAALASPTPLADLRIHPNRREAGSKVARMVTKATIREHVELLLEARLIDYKPMARGGRVIDHYFVSQPHVFAFTEEFRSLAELPGQANAGDETIVHAARRTSTLPSEASLVLLNGVRPGRAFSLSKRAGGPWHIGRRADHHVSLAYDPFVSLDHALVERSRGGLVLRDIPGNRNGTSVNWAPLAKGDSIELRQGDVVGVGRSLLLFREGA